MRAPHSPSASGAAVSLRVLRFPCLAGSLLLSGLLCILALRAIRGLVALMALMALMAFMAPAASAGGREQRGSGSGATASTSTGSKASRDTTSGDPAADLALERELLKATRKVETSYLKDLERIVAWAAASGLKEEGSRLLEKMAKIDPACPAIPKLKKSLDGAAAAAEDKLSELREALRKKVDSASDGHARRLFDLSKSCMQLGLFTRAYGVIKAVLDADPDHKQARDILGWTRDSSQKAWITKWEAQMLKTHYLTKEGWVKKGDRAKWEKGLRPYKGVWVPKGEEERIRKRNHLEPYSAETEHFEVRTNLGREKAYEFGLRLEDFYRVFFEFFVGFYDQVAGAKLLFNTEKAKKKHVVNVFPSKVEYLDFVRSEKGNNELLVRSGGFWSEADACSYFYWTDDPEETISTLYHETTHQLLGETKPESGRSSGNVWIVEGIASYMETWQKVGGKWRPGWRIDDDRLRHVQALLAKSPKWSLADYVRLGHKEFHEAKVRGDNYALGSALSHFFLHSSDEIYREDFIRLLRDYYEGKVTESSLGGYFTVEGARPSEDALVALERQFKEYMKDLKRPGEGAPTDTLEGSDAADAGGAQKSPTQPGATVGSTAQRTVGQTSGAGEDDAETGGAKKAGTRKNGSEKKNPKSKPTQGGP